MLLARQIAAAELGWMERCRAAALVSSMQCQHARLPTQSGQVGPRYPGTLIPAGWVCQAPGQVGAGGLAGRSDRSCCERLQISYRKRHSPEPN